VLVVYFIVLQNIDIPRRDELLAPEYDAINANTETGTFSPKVISF